MIYVFDKKCTQVSELTDWDWTRPAVTAREFYLLDARGKVFHSIMGRIKLLYPWDWPPTIRMTRMILGHEAPK